MEGDGPRRRFPSYKANFPENGLFALPKAVFGQFQLKKVQFPPFLAFSSPPDFLFRDHSRPFAVSDRFRSKRPYPICFRHYSP